MFPSQLFFSFFCTVFFFFSFYLCLVSNFCISSSVYLTRPSFFYRLNRLHNYFPLSNFPRWKSIGLPPLSFAIVVLIPESTLTFFLASTFSLLLILLVRHSVLWRRGRERGRDDEEGNTQVFFLFSHAGRFVGYEKRVGAKMYLYEMLSCICVHISK